MGGYFPFLTENQPQKHKKHAILHTSRANGRGSSPPPPPLATLLCTYRKEFFHFHRKIFCHHRLLVITALSTGIRPVLTMAKQSASKTTFGSKTFYLGYLSKSFDKSEERGLNFSKFNFLLPSVSKI